MLTSSRIIVLLALFLLPACKQVATSSSADKATKTNQTSSSDTISACVVAKLDLIRNIVESVRSETREADCRPGPVTGGRNNETKELKIEVGPEWKLEAPFKLVKESQTNRGSFTGPQLENDRLLTASARCNGNNFGEAGEWARGYITAKKRRVPTNDEIRQAVGSCINGG